MNKLTIEVTLDTEEANSDGLLTYYCYAVVRRDFDGDCVIKYFDNYSSAFEHWHSLVYTHSDNWYYITRVTVNLCRMEML